MKRGTVLFVHQLRCRTQVRLIRSTWSNPIEACTRAHFDEPIVRTHLPFGDVVVVDDPAAVRRVLKDNEANYSKDRFQKRVDRCLGLYWFPFGTSGSDTRGRRDHQNFALETEP